MKTVTARSTNIANRPNIPYPNAATRRELLDRFVDLLLTAGLGVGAAAIVLFIFALA